MYIYIYMSSRYQEILFLFHQQVIKITRITQELSSLNLELLHLTFGFFITTHVTFIKSQY